MSKAPATIIGIGAALVDTEVLVSEDILKETGLTKSQMTLCSETEQAALITKLKKVLPLAKRSSGGSAANSMVAAAELSSSCHMTCQVAADDDGYFFLDDLNASGVQINTAAQSRAGTSGKCLILITPDGERTMNTALCISEEISVANIEPKKIKEAQFIYLEGYLATSETGKQAAIQMQQLANQAGVKVCLTLSDPGIAEHFKPQLKEMLGDKIPYLIFCNEQEAQIWTGSNNLEQSIELMKQQTHCFVITLGKKGAVCFDGESALHVPATPATAINTNGAGDMFAGTFLSAIAQDYSFQTAATLACEGAAMVVSQMAPRLKKSQYQQLKLRLGQLPKNG